MNSSRVNENRPIGVVPDAIVWAEGCGIVNARTMNAADITVCIVRIHHLLVLMMSTNGLQRNLSVHGRYRSEVNNDICPLGTPILANIRTEMLLTRKYGIPSTK